MLKRWQKCLLGWLHSITPTFTRYTNFRPETLVGWHRRFVKRWWWMLVVAGKRRAAERPRMDASVEKIIIDIKADNPSYGSKRISLMERFNRTLTEELFNLEEQAPIRQENAANDAAFMPGTLRAESIPWLGGLHHSYRRVA